MPDQTNPYGSPCEPGGSNFAISRWARQASVLWFLPGAIPWNMAGWLTLVARNNPTHQWSLQSVYKLVLVATIIAVVCVILYGLPGIMLARHYPATRISRIVAGVVCSLTLFLLLHAIHFGLFGSGMIVSLQIALIVSLPIAANAAIVVDRLIARFAYSAVEPSANN